MLGLMLVLTVSSAYKHTFALCDSKPWWKSNSSRCGLKEMIALPFSFGVRRKAPAHKYTAFGGIGLQPRGEILKIHVYPYSVQYFMLPHHFSMVLASALLSCGIYKLISLLNPLWALTAGLSWTFLFYWLSNKHMHIILHANLHRRSMTIMFSIFGFQNHVFTCKKAIIWLGRRDVVWYLQERDW